jgi:putative ABC transport system substrate-binding protein
MMDRRAFMAGAATLIAAPNIVWAQKMRRLAIVNASRPVEQLMAAGGNSFYEAFHDELKQRRYIEGQNLVVSFWTARGRADRDAVAREVVASQPEIIFATSGASIGPHVMRATKTIPIVFYTSDPIASGLVSSLAHPGGNVTGMKSDTGPGMAGKRLQFLSEAIPTLARVAYLTPGWKWEIDRPIIAKAAAQLGVTLTPFIVEQPVSEAAYRRAFAAIVNEHQDAVVPGRSNENNVHRALIIELAAKAKLPSIGYDLRWTEAGVLMSYGIDPAERGRRCAEYVVRILEGENPGDLPVQQPTVFEFIVNLKRAKALGLTLPPAILYAATKFIE